MIKKVMKLIPIMDEALKELLPEIVAQIALH